MYEGMVAELRGMVKRYGYYIAHTSGNVIYLERLDTLRSGTTGEWSGCTVYEGQTNAYPSLWDDRSTWETTVRAYQGFTYLEYPLIDSPSQRKWHLSFRHEYGRSFPLWKGCKNDDYWLFEERVPTPRVRLPVCLKIPAVVPRRGPNRSRHHRSYWRRKQ